MFVDCVTDDEPRMCVPMSDVIRGQFDEGLKLLLGTGGEDPQIDLTVEINRRPSVPLVIVFTMFDLIVPNVSPHGDEYERASTAAYMMWEGRCRTLFGNVRSEIVSSNYSPACVSRRVVVSHLTLFSVQPKFRDLIVRLVATTDEVIIGHYSRNVSTSSEAQRTQSRMSPVTLAWSVSQRASRDINVQAAIECVTLFLPLNLFFSYHTTGLGKAVS